MKPVFDRNDIEILKKAGVALENAWESSLKMTNCSELRTAFKATANDAEALTFTDLDQVDFQVKRRVALVKEQTKIVSAYRAVLFESTDEKAPAGVVSHLEKGYLALADRLRAHVDLTLGNDERAGKVLALVSLTWSLPD